MFSEKGMSKNSILGCFYAIYDDFHKISEKLDQFLPKQISPQQYFFLS